MIAYRGSDIKLSWLHDTDGRRHVDQQDAPKTCGYIKEGLELEDDDDEDDDEDEGFLNSVSNSADRFRYSHWLNRTERMAPLLLPFSDASAISSLADPLMMPPASENMNAERRHKRSKRQSDQYEYTPTKTRCPLLLVADYRFFQEMGGGNTKTTINYLVRERESVERVGWIVLRRFS